MTTRPPRRSPGRPSADRAVQRDTLLDAALACYVRQGIQATSLRDIAREAGVTPAMLHYYFGDAAQLREAVIEERLMPVFERIRTPLMSAAGDLPALLRLFVDGIFAVVQEYPWLPPMWVREVVTEGGALRDLLMTRLAPSLGQLLAARFQQAQAAGELNPALDPRLLMVSLIGLTMFPVAGAPIWRQVFNAENLTMDDVRRHALVLLESGLELGDGKTLL